MTEDSYSLTTEFIKVGFSDHTDLKIFIFRMLSAICLVTTVGKLCLLALTYMNHWLYAPMYIFLDKLDLLGACYSGAITPKMLENIFSADRMISLYECMNSSSFSVLLKLQTAFSWQQWPVTAMWPYATYCSITTWCPRSSAFKYHITGNLYPMVYIEFLLS